MYLRTLAVLVTALGLATAAEAQSYYRRAAPRSLVTDLIASDVGDILTVVINETSTVKNEDKVDRENTTTLQARLEAYTLSKDTFHENVLPKIDIRQSRSFEGNAKQEKDSEVKASIAVIVIDVQPNGNLVVAGSRTVHVDDDTRILRVSGIVRPLDIDSATNRVSSAQVADARISIETEGANIRYVTRGPVGTLFDTMIWAVWPF
jgi:flagellar L-ring protein precursor FlgH